MRPLAVEIPRGRLTAVTGVSGSGKTTLVLESLIPGLRAAIAGEQLPAHVRAVEAEGLRRANLIDATPIGANVRSTVATYSGVLDDLRRAYAKLPEAKERGLKAGAFSYNTGSLRCPTCDGTGQISLDVQFLPDVDIPCPDCGGSRYSGAAAEVRLAGDISLPELLSYTVDQARDALAETGLRSAKAKLAVLSDLGLGYLTLGEATRRFPAARRSASSWQASSRAARKTRSSYLTSLRLACIRLTWRCSSVCCSGLSTTVPRWW